MQLLVRVSNMLPVDFSNCSLVTVRAINVFRASDASPEEFLSRNKLFVLPEYLALFFP